MKKVIVILVVVIALMGTSITNMEKEISGMTSARDLVRTLEDMRMPPRDVELWRQYLVLNDSANSHFSGGGDLEIAHLQAQSGEFTDSQPFLVGTIQINNAVDLATGTELFVSFDEVVHNDNGLIIWDSTDPTKIRLRGSFQIRYVKFSTYTRWEFGASGVRQLAIFFYDVDDVEVGSSLMENFKGGNILVPGLRVKLIPADTAYFKVRVIQTQGSNLDLEQLELTLQLMD